MPTKTVTIAMNGVTGRMGRNQHLARSILAIREQGCLPLADGGVIWPEPILVGRDASRLAAVAKESSLDRYSSDLAAVLGDPDVDIYFDATATASRPVGVRAAIEAGKAGYCEKPLSTSAAEAAELAALARAAGVKNGIVADKLFLPGLRKLDRALRSGFFGRLPWCAAISATGCSRGTWSRRSGRAGTRRTLLHLTEWHEFRASTRSPSPRSSVRLASATAATASMRTHGGRHRWTYRGMGRPKSEPPPNRSRKHGRLATIAVWPIRQP